MNKLLLEKIRKVYALMVPRGHLAIRVVYKDSSGNEQKELFHDPVAADRFVRIYCAKSQHRVERLEN